LIYISDCLSYSAAPQLKIQGEKTGRKGHLSVATEVYVFKVFFHVSLFVFRSRHYFSNALRAGFQILEVAPSLYMVELRKSQGDTLEFHKVSLMQKICMYLFIYRSAINTSSLLSLLDLWLQITE